ncbi:hypothetical protein E1B28_002058 [Marasmius oreades]|uniref:Uncharacterized protein n=1 Tax=Marasmius oreades TaxID=181124 RepID=A0A9P7V4M6_9AGAR|nr:uncharacterized protein E1B28_002058 [Marasmius oreades]KAG7100285.1 hypothetical protein E1B28_002058 [Marasmius oreades]
MAFATRFTFFFALCVALPSLTFATDETKPCSFDKIAKDVQKISAQTLALDDYVQNVTYYSAGTEVAKHVHTDLQGITDAIDATARDMKPCPAPFSENTFQTLLSSVRSIIVGGGVSSGIKQDLDRLHTSSVVLENTWLEKAPEDLEVEAHKLVNEINSVLAFAQAAYAYA